MFFKLAFNSLKDRKGSVLLIFLAIAVSVFTLLGVETIRKQVKDSFNSTISDVDLIVGARTGDINLLLYSVFRLGNASNNISWDTYKLIQSDRRVEWTIPISLGDSHKGYRVLGTETSYFDHYRYGRQQALELAQGQRFSGVFDVVLGAEVARTLNYQLGEKIVLAHGMASTSFSLHDDKPFTIVGILKPTGTPVDQTLHVSLAGIEAIHIDWKNGVKLPGHTVSAEQALQHDLTPKSITAFMVGLKSKMTTFAIRREINEYNGEALLAILPGVALSQLWQLMGVIEIALQLISVLVFIAALLGLSAMLLTALRERRQEIAIMRMLGASPLYIALLIELEALLIAGLASLAAAGTLWLGLTLYGDVLAASAGLFIQPSLWTSDTLVILAGVIMSSAVIGLIPAISAYADARQRNLFST